MDVIMKDQIGMTHRKSLLSKNFVDDIAVRIATAFT